LSDELLIYFVQTSRRLPHLRDELHRIALGAGVTEEKWREFEFAFDSTVRTS
jgi:hypothetical protein